MQPGDERYNKLELGGTQILETVQYFIKYHGINNYYGILINTFMHIQSSIAMISLK